MLKVKELKFWLPLIFPVLVVLIATVLNGDGMNTFSFIYIFSIWGLIIFEYRKIRKNDIVILFLTILTVFISIYREKSNSNYFGIQFSALLISLIFFSERYFNIKEFEKFCIKHYKFSFFISIIIYFILFYSYKKYGLYYERTWATGVFRGPFNLPHTLSYILFFLTLLDLFYFLRLKSLCALILAGGNFLIILMTAVRSALVPFFFIGIYVLIVIKQKRSKKLNNIIICAIIIGSIVLLETGILQRVIDKSLYALHNGGDITNSRGRIFTSSLQALFNEDYSLGRNIILGIGMDRLFQYNRSMLGVAIHAHNDLIDALTCYGIIGFVEYLVGFLSFTQKNRKWEIITLLSIVFFNGLFAYGEAIPLIIFFRLFFETEYIKRGKISENNCFM